ncbi:MAG: hypothetical protein RR505_05055, partial [Raoultibacter sp.]
IGIDLGRNKIMRQQTTLQEVTCKALSVFLTACLIVGLAPAVALGDTSVNVKVEAPAQVSETVVLDSGAEAKAPDSTDADVSVSKDVVGPESAPDQINSAVPLSPDATPKPSQITTDVALGTTPDMQTETLLVDGLTYLVDRESKSATLTGWYGNAPAGDLSVPSQVSDGANVNVYVGVWCIP